MPESHSGSRRKWPLYTEELTPLSELPDALSDVIGAILFPEETERPSNSEVYPWLYRLDADRREEFINYCVELDCCHEEIEFAGYDLETATDFSYASGIYEDAAPHFRRLALIYHLDNVDHRIYAYREKVFQLLNLFLCDVSSSSNSEEFRKAIRDGLSRASYGRVVTLLNKFEDVQKTPRVADALKRRRRLVHFLAIRHSESLQARRRVEELVTGLKPVDALVQLADVEARIKEGREDIERVCETLATFREELIQALKSTTKR